MAISSIILSALFLEILSGSNTKKFRLFSLVLFIASAFIILSYGLNNFLQTTDEEQYLINQRRSYYPDNLGRLFQNKVAFSIHKIEQSIFYNLDPNLYFFAGHPRERAQFDEFAKYPPFFLPFFIIGLIWLINQKSKPAIVYFAAALILGTLSRSTLVLGPVLVYPFANSIIVLGVLKLWKFIKK